MVLVLAEKWGKKKGGKSVCVWGRGYGTPKSGYFQKEMIPIQNPSFLLRSMLVFLGGGVLVVACLMGFGEGISYARKFTSWGWGDGTRCDCKNDTNVPCQLVSTDFSGSSKRW